MSVLTVHVTGEIVVRGKIQCASLCQTMGDNCQVYLYNKVTGSCKLVNTNEPANTNELISRNTMGYFNYGEWIFQFLFYLKVQWIYF